MVAFPWLVYQKTGSAFSTGVVLALYTLPYVLFGPFAGVVIDRFNKRRLMIVADLVRAGLVLTVALVAHPGLPFVFAISFAMASVAVFFDPCKLSLLPDIVQRRQLVRANSLLTMGENLSEIIGYSVAGLVAYYFSTRIAFAADSGTFLVSAAALALMAYVPPVREAALRQARHVGAEIMEGIRFLFGHRQLAANTVLVVAAVLGLGAAYPLTFLLAVDVLGQGTKAFGLMEAAIGVGYLGGSALLAGLGSRVRKGYAMTVGLGVMGAALVCVGLLQSLAAILVAFLVAGSGQRGRADLDRHVLPGDGARAPARPRLGRPLRAHAGLLRPLDPRRRRSRRHLQRAGPVRRRRAHRRPARPCRARDGAGARDLSAAAGGRPYGLPPAAVCRVRTPAGPAANQDEVRRAAVEPGAD